MVKLTTHSLTIDTFLSLDPCAFLERAGPGTGKNAVDIGEPIKHVGFAQEEDEIVGA